MNSIVKLAFAVAAAVALWGCVPAQAVDQPASNLDVKFVVLDTSPAPSGGTVPVIAQFSFDGPVVQFGGGASVACNGLLLGFDGLGYAGAIPLASTYSFVHVRNGVTTSATVSAPPRPQVLSPAPGAQVTRTTSLTLTYQAAGATVGVRGIASDGTTGVSGGLEPDNGDYTGLDVSMLHTGAGTVGLTREVTGIINGTGFKSASSDYTSGSADVAITWN